MDRKLFLQSLNQQKQDYSKIRKDRRNTPNEFKWLFEEMNSQRKVLNEKESFEPTFMQQAAAALLPQSWAQATGLFDEPKKEPSAAAKAAKERMDAARKEAQKKEDEFVGPPAPEVEEPQGTSTTVAAAAPETARDEKTGKDLDAFDPRDFEHNLKVYDRAMKRDLERVQKGEMSKEQAASNREQFQSRIQSFVKDEKQREQFAAVEQGIDNFATAASFIPGAGQVVAGVHAASLMARQGLYGDSTGRDYKSDAASAALAAALPSVIGVAGKAVPAAGKAIGAAAGKVADKAPTVAKALEGAAKGIETTAKVGSQVAQSVAGKGGTHALGAAAGGYGAYEASKKAELGLPATVAAVIAGSVLGSRGAKALEKVPGLGKQIADPKLPGLPGMGGAKAPAVTPATPAAQAPVTPGFQTPKVKFETPKGTAPKAPTPTPATLKPAPELGMQRPMTPPQAEVIVGTNIPQQPAMINVGPKGFVDPLAPIKMPELGPVSTTQIKPATPLQKAAAGVLAGTQVAAPGGVSTVQVKPPALVAPAPTVPQGPKVIVAPVAPKAPAAKPSAPKISEPAPAKPSAPSIAVPSVGKSSSVAPSLQAAIQSVQSASTTQSTTQVGGQTTPASQQQQSQQQQQQSQQQSQQVTGGGSTQTPPSSPPPPPPPTQTPPPPPPPPPPSPTPTEDEDKIVRDPDAAEIRGKKLGEFEAGEAGKYTKSVVGKRGQDGGEDQFVQSPYFRVPTQSALDYRRSSAAIRQGLPESVEMKRRIETAVSKYLKSKEGMELDKHLKSLKK